MYSHEAANKFTDEIGVKRDSVINNDAGKMIQHEAEAEIARGALKGQKNQYDKAVDIALDRLLDWFKNGAEYHIEPIHEFVASHRRACIWAVLLRKHSNVFKKIK